MVSGKGLIQFRKVGTKDIIEYHVSGEKIEVVDIPVGYTHNIINEGDTDLVTIMWVNGCLTPRNQILIIWRFEYGKTKSYDYCWD